MSTYMDMRRIYYYQPQWIAVRAILEPMLRPEVKLVPVYKDGMEIKGAESGAFVIVSQHPRGLPLRLREELEERGFFIMTLDDSNCRRFAARRMQQ